MNNQINVYQQRLFNKLFAVLPSIRKTDGFKTVSNRDFEINHFFYFKNKDFWFANDEKEDKYYFLFGLYNKHLSEISGKDTCLVIDFDKNIQFTECCLGLFYIKNFEIHILINNKILKERYPNINTSDFKVSTIKLPDHPINLEIIDLGGLNHNFIDNIEKLIKTSSIIRPQIPKVVKTDSLGTEAIVSKMNSILEDLAMGKSENEAIMHANVSKTTYEYWINRGKQDFGDVYIQFYRYTNEIKSERQVSNSTEGGNNIIEEEITPVDESIYEPLLVEYENLFNSMNQSGIAWVDKIEGIWIYSRNINGEAIKLSANTICELYNKVVDNDLIWGIRDYDRAKQFIDFPDDFEIPEIEIEDLGDIIDPNIYKPLPEEYEKSFNSMNQSGIAWVNKIGDKLYYVKSVNKRSIRLAAENIYDLYEKVKNANQIWGIRDYDRAKEFIDFPDDFEIPLNPQVEETTSGTVDIDYDILAPLPIKYEKSFNSMNQSGIAWVNQISNKLYYVKSVKKREIRLSAENIYDLYEKVKNANQIWGIRDYSKASKYIDIPEDFEIPKKQEIETIKSIYAPLSRHHLSKFNPNPNNKTGIAWVNKVGKKWFYQRQQNGKTVRISDSNIIKLHQKVINNNQIWGIIDIDKARKSIETNSIDEKQPVKLPKTKPSKIDSKITVNCIKKSKNNFDILIRGVIKNKDLIEILTKLDSFKENIKRIITNSINDDSDIFIELELDKNLLPIFVDKIEGLGWNITD